MMKSKSVLTRNCIILVIILICVCVWGLNILFVQSSVHETENLPAVVEFDSKNIDEEVLREILQESNQHVQGIRPEWIEKIGVGRKEDIFKNDNIKMNLRGSR
jgi:hypothetical protein